MGAESRLPQHAAVRSIPNKIKPSLETFNFVTILLPRRTWILAQFIDIEKRRSSALHVALASSSRVRRHGGGARIVIASPGPPAAREEDSE